MYVLVRVLYTLVSVVFDGQEHIASDVVVHPDRSEPIGLLHAAVEHGEHDVDAYPYANVVPAVHAVQGAYCVDEEYPGLHTHPGRSWVKYPETAV